MVITINNPKTKEAITFDKVHLTKLTISQSLDEDSKKMMNFRMFLVGNGLNGTWDFDKESLFDFNTTDIEMYALQLYMKDNDCTLQDAYTHYLGVSAGVNNSDLLTCMAYFQKGLALIYNNENPDLEQANLE